MGGRIWTQAEDDLLCARYRDTLTSELARIINRAPKAVLNRANALGLHKSIALIADTARERNRQRNERGLSNRGHFLPGHQTWNKGMDYKAGGRSVQTQFQPGEKPWTWKPVGSLRVVDGQLQLKTNDNPGNGNDRWKPYTRIVWEAENGPVPADHLVVFKPGRHTIDPDMITLDAVELITRAENMRRNTVHRLPPEIREMCHLRATLSAIITRRSKRSDQSATAAPATATEEAPAP